MLALLHFHLILRPTTTALATCWDLWQKYWGPPPLIAIFFNLQKCHQFKILSLGAMARKTPKRRDKRQKKKRMDRNTKKRLHFFMDDSKLAFNDWKEVLELGSFNNCEAYIEWCHIGRGFLHDHYRKQCKADQATCIFANGLFSRNGAQRCANTSTRNLFLSATNVPCPFCKWCMPKCCLGNVNWMTINIQSKSNMKAPLHSYFGPTRKFLHGGLGKKSPSTEIPNDMVVQSATSSNIEKTSCT